MLALLFLAPAALAFGGGPKRPRGLALRAGSAAVEERAPALTLYRDTNGWCPFCERVWVALEKKGIPYDEVLINLQDKPDWYKEIVPTTLVPAIEFHDDAWDASARGSGRLVWESADILAAPTPKAPGAAARRRS
ncbi:glutathione transferase [Aureococcus anophagefferens]|nr:glutathione transferase [Aureococcus anophagefferens]